MTTQNYTTMPKYQYVHDLVYTFFGGNSTKTTQWFETNNPLLGGLTPAFMLSVGRGEKLLKIVKEWIEGNRA